MKKHTTTIDPAKNALECILSQRTVSFYPVFAKAFGSVPAAVMLSQGLFWQYKAKHGKPAVIDGEEYFAKTVDDWYDETSITESAQKLARGILVRHGVLKEKLAGLPAKMHFRVDLESVVAVINGYLLTGVSVAVKHGNKERQLTRTGSGKFRQQEATKDGGIIIESFESFESEGEGNTPAPETSTFKEEKKETREFAPGRAEPVEAKNPPLPKVAQKGISPAGPLAELSEEDCTKFEAEAAAENNEARARITDPKLPGVPVFDGIKPAFPAASPAQWREAAKEIQSWEYPNPGSPKDLKGVLLRYAEQNPENWRDNVLESGKATKMTAEKIDEYLTAFCNWQFKTDFTKGKLSQYTAGFSLWLERQPRFDGMNAPKDGGQRGQNGQPVAIATRNPKILNL